MVGSCPHRSPSRRPARVEGTPCPACRTGCRWGCGGLEGGGRGPQAPGGTRPSFPWAPWETPRAFGSLLPRAKSARDEMKSWHRLRQKLASSLASRTLLNPQKGLGLQGRPCSRRKRTKLNSPRSPFQAANSCGSETQLPLSTPWAGRAGLVCPPGGPGGQRGAEPHSWWGQRMGPPREALSAPSWAGAAQDVVRTP